MTLCAGHNVIFSALGSVKTLVKSQLLLTLAPYQKLKIDSFLSSYIRCNRWQCYFVLCTNLYCFISRDFEDHQALLWVVEYFTIVIFSKAANVQKFAQSNNISKKWNLHYTRLIPFLVSRMSGAHLRGFASRPTHQGCNGGESLATCGRFDRLGILKLNDDSAP